MPVGIQRINARRSQPNPHIVFIKPLKGPDEEVARQFLERIAAQCVPIMREHHLTVMTLEEYEPNREFVGRNFNAGEVIQLVLKAHGSRRWLPFQYVQMVMMHELAHCRQMNHSRAFWSVRDAFAAQMRRLWADRYVGEGIWGRGAKLGTAADGGPPMYERNVALPGDGGDDGVLLEHLCGGTYQSRRGRKRKVKPTLTYREREDRRIRRKFGVNGVALGDDLEERAKLDARGTGSSSPSKAPALGKQTTLSVGSGKVGMQKETTARTLAGTTKTEQKRLATKPRVAVSKRGRELRAAAALARFEQNATAKKEEAVAENVDEIEAIKREEDGYEMDVATDSDGDSDVVEYEADPDQPTLAGPDAVDIDGKRMLDGSGGSMVRVCEGEDGEDDSDAKRELRELLQAGRWGGSDNAQKVAKSQSKPQPTSSTAAAASASRIPSKTPKQETAKDERQEVPFSQIPHVGRATVTRPSPTSTPAAPPATPLATGACPVCSFANSEQAITCTVCGHVLHADAVPGAWHCQSATCRQSQGVRFLNAGDCGVCGVCGQRKGM
ncbi:WLM domain-containing protein [Sporothrix schenckii 1099-18]|uniref:WLM domain-containing protein n=2 Tax=Sporothrix schenckii TaxID=29908 RepID=U7PQR0_SPOS1|nr:WLM domain-containing protein [Sporothrix schenckii 1099-18]ERS97968.1 hypothetical protein HMPREF1624_06140 [Sporothrix schenckii ATCC 58251]KJR82552.1 WLM domain-containing protein [Sporothrix schenckii 1099-18]